MKIVFSRKIPWGNNKYGIPKTIERMRYITSALNCIIDKPIICNAMWIDVPNRMKSRWENVEFFLEKFPSFCIDIDTNTVFEEFLDYQTLSDEY